jgi:hypothetical protein
MKLKQHIPDYVDTDSYTIEADSITEILNDPRVASWTKLPSFFRFSYEKYPDRPFEVTYPATLMAEFRNGAEWWVVGYLTEIPNLPIWDIPGKEDIDVSAILLLPKLTDEKLKELSEEYWAGATSRGEWEEPWQEGFQACYDWIKSEMLKDET